MSPENPQKFGDGDRGFKTFGGKFGDGDNPNFGDLLGFIPEKPRILGLGTGF